VSTGWVEYFKVRLRTKDEARKRLTTTMINPGLGESAQDPKGNDEQGARLMVISIDPCPDRKQLTLCSVVLYGVWPLMKLDRISMTMRRFRSTTCIHLPRWT